MRRRPVRLAGVLPDYLLEPRRAIADDFPPLPRAEAPEREVRFKVRRSDLDMNRHVNNAVYVGWALESVPEQVAEASGRWTSRSATGRKPWPGTRFSPTASRKRAPRPTDSCRDHRRERRRELARLRVNWG